MTLRYRCNALSTELSSHMDRWSILSQYGFLLMPVIEYNYMNLELVTFERSRKSYFTFICVDFM